MTVLLIAIVVVTSTAGDLLLTRGMKETGEVSDFAPLALVRRLGRALGNPSILAGVVTMAVSFLAFVAALAIAPVSLVVPATAATYVGGTLGAKWYLREQVSTTRWLGTLIVIGGVILVSMS
ncbi:MAG: EamA family transporter [Acidobacteria bacterium]|nr:EamA family transporter [Acidobacteriota bacterium]